MKCVALCGGVGGAKLALGLSHLLPGDDLTLIVNTGDDFTHLGLHISPDLDTVMYTLAGLSNAQQGWGRAGETWQFMAALRKLGGEDWFQLGDLDLATHVERTRRMAAGQSLSHITRDLFAALNVGARILPMSDDPVRTIIHTNGGPLAFQHYFVRDKCAPAVTGFSFAGCDQAAPAPGVLQALNDPELACIVICPSNPFVSIDPILAVPGVRAALKASSAPVIAVSPIVGGRAIKGPTAKMMQELGVPETALAVAAHYEGLLDGFILDETDAALAPQVRATGLACRTAQSVMHTLQDRVELAGTVLDFAAKA
ncbi:MAG: 2-phospho-L-lactate transferase [Alphaproteobacteria bacterium]